jgi:hypothetical protein
VFVDNETVVCFLKNFGPSTSQYQIKENEELSDIFISFSSNDIQLKYFIKSYTYQQNGAVL